MGWSVRKPVLSLIFLESHGLLSLSFIEVQRDCYLHGNKYFPSLLTLLYKKKQRKLDDKCQSTLRLCIWWATEMSEDCGELENLCLSLLISSGWLSCGKYWLCVTESHCFLKEQSSCSRDIWFLNVKTNSHRKILCSTHPSKIKLIWGLDPA